MTNLQKFYNNVKNIKQAENYMIASANVDEWNERRDKILSAIKTFGGNAQKKFAKNLDCSGLIKRCAFAKIPEKNSFGKTAADIKRELQRTVLN